jgi:DNA-binding beta-propeller fold protein YncE
LSHIPKRLSAPAPQAVNCSALDVEGTIQGVVMKIARIAAVLPFVIVGATILFAAPASSPEYKVVATYKLGGEGGWDYLTFDTQGHRLFISRGTHVMVVDPDSGKVLGDIAGTNGVHGIALADDLGKGFTSNGRDNNVTIFDLKTLQPAAEKPKTGQNPDAIAYDRASKRVFTFNGRSSDATAIDASSGAVAGTIPLGGKPETGVFDGSGKGYVNVEDKAQIVQFDTKTLKVLNTWSIAPCEEPSGLAIDVKHRRLFAGCHNKMMAVVNADNGKVVATPAIGEGVDANAFDPGTQLAYSSNGGGAGTITVVHEDSPDSYTVVQNAETLPRARTMTLDPKTHRVYTVTAEFGPAPAPTADQPRPRPPMVPDSFKLLVLASDKLK